MKVMLHAFVMVALVLAATAAQAPPPQVDLERLGPQVGEVVPDFSAVDQFGRVQTLKSILGRDGAMFVFNRSADW